MRYTVTRQRICIIGYIWMPQGALCAQEYNLNTYEMGNIVDPTNRAEVADWIDKNTGDFSEIVDFQADFHIGDKHILHDWAKGEESAILFCDAMYPAEDA